MVRQYISLFENNLQLGFQYHEVCSFWKSNAYFFLHRKHTIVSFRKKTVAACLLKFLILFYLFFIDSLVMENATWSRGNSGRPARAHKVLIKFLMRSTNIELVKDAFKQYIVNSEH